MYLSNDPILKKIQKLFLKKRYGESIVQCNKFKHRYKENYVFNCLLAFSYLYLANWKESHFYTLRCLSLEPYDAEMQLLLSIIYLKKNNINASLNILLKILDLEPHHTRARHLLNQIKTKKPNKLRIWLKSSHLLKNYPIMPDLYQYKWKKRIYFILILVSIVLLAVLLKTTYPYLYEIWLEKKLNEKKISFPQELKKNTLAYIDLPDSDLFQIDNQNFNLYLQKIKKNLINDEDNLAQKNINFLLNSNLNEEGKMKIKLIEKYIQKPKSLYLKNNFSYMDIKQNPALFHNTFILWEGKVQEIDYNKKELRFMFYLGYQTTQVILAKIPTQVPFSINLTNNTSIKILAQVKWTKENTEHPFLLKAQIIAISH